MRCPFCHARDSRVVDSRELSGGDSIRRRRECVECHRRFTTYERVEAVTITVVKKDGRREPFSQDKLRQKIRVALTKRPISEDTLDTIVSHVESEVMKKGTKEVSSTEIGEAVLRELKATDQVAYIRFASVYREFADLEDLRREVEGLASPLDGRLIDGDHGG
ncbi:MAG TPA: transcriptional regulator NrdR [Thermomicrobiales bacterium]|nr:transcriptional regulator NrdR [Thermomicrobiales bacterium]